nr:MAG TPA: hypothetical protein [Microviridae sp.]
MRNFAYVAPEFEQDSVTPTLIEGNPCYEASVYDYEKFCLCGS